RRRGECARFVGRAALRHDRSRCPFPQAPISRAAFEGSRPPPASLLPRGLATSFRAPPVAAGRVIEGAGGLVVRGRGCAGAAPPSFTELSGGGHLLPAEHLACRRV